VEPVVIAVLVPSFHSFHAVTTSFVAAVEFDVVHVIQAPLLLVPKVATAR